MLQRYVKNSDSDFSLLSPPAPVQSQSSANPNPTDESGFGFDLWNSEMKSQRAVNVFQFLFAEL